VQTFHDPPSLIPRYTNSQQWVTPKLGLNSTWVKGFLARMRQHRQHESFCLRCQLTLTAYSLSFPTCLSHPRKCAPSLLNNPSTTPLPFQDFNNRLDRKSQSTIAIVGLPQKITSPVILSPRERFSRT
jgi:hypothetical protein